MRNTATNTTIYLINRLTIRNKWIRNLVSVVGFAGAMWAAAAAGKIMIPGTPVPITLQTLVVMLAGVLLPWRQAASAMLLYIAMGACGLPVFAGGGSFLSLVGPSAGFILGFVPAVVVIAVVAGLPRAIGVVGANSARADSADSTIGAAKNDGRGSGLREMLGRAWSDHWTVRVMWFALAAMLGGILVQYACGIAVQCAMTHMPLSVVLPASLGFVPGDLIKATAVAVLAASTVRR